MPPPVRQHSTIGRVGDRRGADCERHRRRQPSLLLDSRQPHPSPTPPSSHSTQKLQQPLPGSYTRSTETTRCPRKKAFRAASDIPSKDAGRANVANWLMSHSPCVGGRRAFAPRTRALRGTPICPAPSIQSWGTASRKPTLPPPVPKYGLLSRLDDAEQSLATLLQPPPQQRTWKPDHLSRYRS